jgi:hypothetical protein
MRWLRCGRSLTPSAKLTRSPANVNGRQTQRPRTIQACYTAHHARDPAIPADTVILRRCLSSRIPPAVPQHQRAQYSAQPRTVNNVFYSAFAPNPLALWACTLIDCGYRISSAEYFDCTEIRPRRKKNSTDCIYLYLKVYANIDFCDCRDY